MHGFHHPAIYRAVYIEAVDYTADFLTDLVIYAVKIRNHGIPDYGLIVHLSELVAGSLYAGTQGHSTVYEESSVYQ